MNVRANRPPSAPVRFLRTLLSALAAAPLAAALPGPHTAPFNPAPYTTVLHVDAGRGQDATGDGSIARPFASLPAALERAALAPGRRTALLLSTGRYRQPTFALKPRVDLFGGFAAPGGTRDILRHASILDGEDARRIALGADDVRLDGLHFSGGRVSGRGAALLCDGSSPTLTNCVFTANRTLAPRGWDPPQLHLAAHDGGAVMCLNGAAPRFSHCLFSDNTTECGRGGALAADRGAAPRIASSVFVHNRAGLDDPMRSSDGGALSFFDGSGGELIGCVISANTALARNDAGGVFVALWSSPRIADCVFTANDAGDDAGALFIGGQEHRYGAPLDPMPPADKFNVVVERCVFAGNTNSTKNSGAMRITMESRATFRDNVIAENHGGFYLQRSEIVAERNTVWQDWRFVEDKPSLGASRLAGNILRGPLAGTVEARVTIAHNMAEPALGGDTLAVADVFLADAVEGRIATRRFDPLTMTTTITATADLPDPSALAGRPVALGNGRSSQWRVIKSATPRDFIFWGRLEAETNPATQFAVLRTFTLAPAAPAGIGARLPP